MSTLHYAWRMILGIFIFCLVLCINGHTQAKKPIKKPSVKPAAKLWEAAQRYESRDDFGKDGPKDNWKLAMKTDIDKSFPHDEKVTVIRYSANGDGLFVGTNAGNLVCWDIAGQKLKWKTAVFTGKTAGDNVFVQFLAVSPAGDNVAVWYGESRAGITQLAYSIVIINATTGSKVKEIVGKDGNDYYVLQDAHYAADGFIYGILDLNSRAYATQINVKEGKYSWRYLVINPTTDNCWLPKPKLYVPDGGKAKKIVAFTCQNKAKTIDFKTAKRKIAGNVKVFGEYAMKSFNEIGRNRAIALHAESGSSVSYIVEYTNLKSRKFPHSKLADLQIDPTQGTASFDGKYYAVVDGYVLWVWDTATGKIVYKSNGGGSMIIAHPTKKEFIAYGAELYIHR